MSEISESKANGTCDRIEWVVPDDVSIFIDASTQYLWKCRWYRWIYFPGIIIVAIVSYILMECYEQHWAAAFFILSPAALIAPVVFWREAGRVQYRRNKEYLPVYAWIDCAGYGSKENGAWPWSARDKTIETSRYFFICVREPRKRVLFIPKVVVNEEIDDMRDILGKYTKIIKLR